MKTIISLCGEAGTGKTTTAKALQSYLKLLTNNVVGVASFAQTLKDIENRLHNLITGHDDLMVDMPSGKKRRNQLQMLGDYIKQNYGENYFCEKMKEAIEEFEGEIIIIEDLRYLNEAQFLNDNFKKPEYNHEIFILENKLNKINLDEDQKNHSSETEIAKICTNINNVNSLYISDDKEYRSKIDICNDILKHFNYIKLDENL